MKRKAVKRSGSPPGVNESQRPGGVQRKEKTRSRSWLKRGLLAVIVIFSLVLFSLTILPELFQHHVYTHRIRVPLFVDLSRPADLSLNHTINMYLTSEEGISLGVWHTVPESHWKEAQGKNLEWYQSTLSDGSPVFIYLHGNRDTRAAPHRVGVAEVLSALGYHVLVPDYRGFGDSTGEPTEAGLTTDALYLYNWVKERSGTSMVVIWGHSLGTGVSTNAAVKLNEQGVVFDGLILEGAFNSARQQFLQYPFAWYYWKFPGTGCIFPEPWADKKAVFPTEENLKKMRCPILFLHSEDDHVVPIQFAQQVSQALYWALFTQYRLYEVAVSAQNAERVKMVSFNGSLGYLHNGLYRDAHLPDIIKKFVLSL